MPLHDWNIVKSYVALTELTYGVWCWYCVTGTNEQKWRICDVTYMMSRIYVYYVTDHNSFIYMYICCGALTCWCTVHALVRLFIGNNIRLKCLMSTSLLLQCLTQEQCPWESCLYVISGVLHWVVVRYEFIYCYWSQVAANKYWLYSLPSLSHITSICLLRWAVYVIEFYSTCFPSTLFNSTVTNSPAKHKDGGESNGVM